MPARQTTARKPAVKVDPANTEQLEVVKQKEFTPGDMIPCRSYFLGRLTFNGESGVHYFWAKMGDVKYVQYVDLKTAFMETSDYIFEPLLIIEDEDFLNDPFFQELHEIYEKLWSEDDINTFLSLPNQKFENELRSAPAVLKNLIKSKVGSLVSKNNFDSIKKIEIIDSICGTDFKAMI